MRVVDTFSLPLCFFIFNDTMKKVFPSCFGTFYDRNPWVITWLDVYRMTATNDNYIDANTRLSREARRHGCDDIADELKAGCGGITPAVWMMDGRTESHIRGLTQVCISDTDHVSDDDMHTVKRMAYADSHTLFGGVTNSMRGIRVMYPWMALDEEGKPLPSEFFVWDGAECHSDFLERVRPYHDAAFLMGNEYYSELLGYPWDRHTSDMNRLSFFCHDANAVFNPHAEPFVVRPEHVIRQKRSNTTYEAPRQRLYQLNDDENVFDKVERWVSRDVVYVEGSRNRYIVRCCLLLRDFNVAPEIVLQWLNVRFPDYETETTREAIVRSVYKPPNPRRGSF